MVTYRVIIGLFCVVLSQFASANVHDIQIYARGYNYVIIASPSHNVLFESQRTSQRLLSPNLLIESDVSAEQIPVRYSLNGYEYDISLLVSANISSPYLAMSVENRIGLPVGENVTIKVNTNVPDRAIGSYSAKLNGRDIQVIDGKIRFDAYSTYSKLEVSAQLLSANMLTVTKILKHEIQPQLGCDVVFDRPTLYAVCFSNLGTIEFSQFYLDNIPIGNEYGEYVVGDSVPNDLKLEILVNNELHAFNIEQVGSSFVSIPRG